MAKDFNAPVRTDLHIHLVGGKNEGCSVSGSLLKAPWTRFISWHLGLSWGHVDTYVDHLVKYLEESPIEIGVILACDAAYDTKGERDPNSLLVVPNDYVLKVAKEHPNLLPGVSIHPGRRDALEELDRCVEAGAVLVKWIPNAQAIDPLERRWKPFYRKLADHGLPLLTHTGCEFTLNQPSCQHFGETERLLPALEEGVTVIAAHCGISYGGLMLRHTRVWIELVRKYPNLFGDISALSFWLSGKYVRRLLTDSVASERLVNGSDFPIPSWARITDFFKTTNPFTRDYEIKKRLGVPEKVFSRGYDLLGKNKFRKARQRPALAAWRL